MTMRPTWFHNLKFLKNTEVEYLVKELFVFMKGELFRALRWLTYSIFVPKPFWQTFLKIPKRVPTFETNGEDLSSTYNNLFEDNIPLIFYSESFSRNLLNRVT